MVCDRLIVTFYFGLLFALLPPKNQNSAQQTDGQTDGQMDGWKKWHIEMSATTKNFVKAAAVQLPYVSAEMTLPEFRKCWMDWNDINIFKKFQDSRLMLNYIAVVMQTSKTVLLALYLFFFLLFEDELLNAIEGIVTKQSHLSAHCLTLSSTLQSPHETIVVKLKSLAPDCAFACPACNCDLQFINIWDQFIQGLCNKTLRTDILGKGNHLKEL